MKNEKRNSTRLTSGAIGGILLVCASLLFGCASALGQGPKIRTWAHEHLGKPDPGVTTPGPKGSTITTYKDKWTKTTETDNSVPGKPETKETIKDDTGKVREIFKRDPKTGQLTYHFVIWDEPNGDKTTYTDIGSVQTKVVEKPNGDKKSYTWKLDPRTKKNAWVEDETDMVSSTGSGEPTLIVVSDTKTEYLSQGKWAPAVLAWVHPAWPKLEGAKWIWTSNTVTQDEAQNGSAITTFRRRFTPPIGAKHGVIQISADNAYELYLNDQFIGRSGPLDASSNDDQIWRAINSYTLDLRLGENELKVRAINYHFPYKTVPTPFDNPAGVIFLLKIERGSLSKGTAPGANDRERP